MIEKENKILSLLDLGYNIDIILKELDMDEESLADTIIELETKELIILEDKNWVLAPKGKDILQEMKELLKKLKIEYLYGDINKDDFQKKKKELESIIFIEKEKIEKKLDKKEDKEKKVICSKCRKENKIESRYCYKCGEPLKYS